MTWRPLCALDLCVGKWRSSGLEKGEGEDQEWFGGPPDCACSSFGWLGVTLPGGQRSCDFLPQRRKPVGKERGPSRKEKSNPAGRSQQAIPMAGYVPTPKKTEDFKEFQHAE